jgi:glycosyltransferase involved in cell wall biosynthesis
VRIAFLTSTPLDFARGSGTFVGISTLARAAEALGAEIGFFTPSTRFPVYTLERLWFNRGLRHVDFRGFDAIAGFDMDGYLVPPRHGVPHVASIKGVIADEMRFEGGVTRRMMAIQAGCERKHVSRANLVITTSAYAAARIRELYELREAPRVVPECIDLTGWRDLFARNPAAPDPAKFTVLSVCRFYPRKRLAILLRAAARLRTQLPHLEVRIAGGGPEEARLLNLWRTLRLESTVRWLGNVSQAALAREYQGCDLFCLPSVQEGFGIVFLEAMAAGKPIVAARAAAVPEVVADGVLGLLAEPENEEALASAVARLSSDPALRTSLGQNCRRAVEQYDARRVAGLFLAELNGAARCSPVH